MWNTLFFSLFLRKTESKISGSKKGTVPYITACSSIFNCVYRSQLITKCAMHIIMHIFTKSSLIQSI